MGPSVALRSPQRFHIGGTAAAAGRDVTLINALHHYRAGHLVEEFSIEPVHQPAHLDAAAELVRPAAEIAGRQPARLVEIFGDDAGAGYRRRALLDQDGRSALRIERQKVLPPLPHPL